MCECRNLHVVVLIDEACPMELGFEFTVQGRPIWALGTHMVRVLHNIIVGSLPNSSLGGFRWGSLNLVCNMEHFCLGFVFAEPKFVECSEASSSLCFWC